MICQVCHHRPALTEHRLVICLECTVKLVKIAHTIDANGGHALGYGQLLAVLEVIL